MQKKNKLEKRRRRNEEKEKRKKEKKMQKKEKRRRKNQKLKLVILHRDYDIVIFHWFKKKKSTYFSFGPFILGGLCEYLLGDARGWNENVFNYKIGTRIFFLKCP